jgi:hypothetical protein
MPDEPTAEQILEWFVSHLEIKAFEMGGQVIKDKHGDTKLALTYVLSQNPRQTYGLVIAGNSYDEACLGELGNVLNAARKLLGKPVIPLSAGAVLVQKVT